MNKIGTHFKLILFFVISGGITASISAQTYNNSWINYSQQYYKFKIAETGIYRIDSTVLANALAVNAISLSSINPQSFQIFARGVEVPLYIKGEGDGVFNGADFIEFYAQKNDGWLDESLYGGAVNHPSPYYSLFNDTINYYLTWGTPTVNSRLLLETDTNFLSYTPINSFDKEVIEVYSNGSKNGGDPYYDGVKNVVDGGLFGFAATEGWFDNGYTTAKSKNISTKNVYSLGANATFNAVVVSWNNPTGTASDNHHLRVILGSSVFDTTFSAYKKIDVQINVPVGDLGTTSTLVNFTTVNDLGVASDKQTIAYLTLKYPHTMDLEGADVFDKIYLNDNLTESKSLFQFSNFNVTGEVLFYDITNSKRVTVVPNGGGYQCLVPNSGTEKECFISSESEIKNITLLTGVNNGGGIFTDYEADPKDTAYIIITHPTLRAEADLYADYRRNLPINSLNIPQQNSVVYDINDLYDQYAYGIEKHPLAIRGFIDHIANVWATVPNYLFLIGKAVKSSESRRNLTAFHNNLVPSYGDPASDIMLTSGLGGTVFQPLIPTGRLAAKTGIEVDWYRQKVEDYEKHNSDPFGGAAWMKTFLHFAGGSSPGETGSFMGSLNGYKVTIEDTLFGATVTSFAKSSTAPIQNNLSDSIKDFIEDGVAMMTFFGHASTSGGFDQNIDVPAAWPNQDGKYPLVMGLACFTGDIHTPTANSTSEDYVIIKDKGAIAFFSGVDLGVQGPLNTYAREFYRNLAYKNYKGSFGRSIKNTIINTQRPFNPISDLRNSTALSMTLHGDPAVSLNSFELPDYMIQTSSVTFNPTIITSDIDSFEVNVLVTNLGKAIDSPIAIEVTRMFQGTSFNDTTYIKFFSGIPYQNIISFKLPVDIVRGLGQNTFFIEIDGISQIGELSENNNTVSIGLNIQSGEIIPIYPYEFMIVPNQGITLKASTAFPFEPLKNYVFEVDTTDLFNSPIKETVTINAPGGIVSWTPALLQVMPDSAVYFWRVSKDSINATGFSWRKRSFQYIQGKEGWQQDHFFQFENDGFEFVTHDRNTRRFGFTPNVKELRGVTYGAATSPELFDIAYFLNTSVQGRAGWSFTSSLHVAIIDSLTLEPWSAVSDRPNLGHVNNFSAFSGTSKEHIFIFRQNSPTQMQALADMLKDSIPSGNHVLMWTWYHESFNSYTPIDTILKNQLGSMGAMQIQNIADSLPFLFYSKIGNNSSTIEVVGNSISHKALTLSTTLISSANFGNVYSEILGPATRWDSLSWRMSSLELPTTKDSTVLNVFGVDASGNETLLIANLPTDSGDIKITSRVNAGLYPYLKLNAHITDDSLFSAPQIDRWQITYDGVPEAALDPNINFTFQNDTVDEGVNVTLSIAIKNISRYDMDSLLISFSVLDKNNNLHILPYDRQKPLLSDSVFIANLSFSTFGLRGLNKLLIDVNPNNDQLEQYHFNNLAQISFYVNSDKINPLLDVTFDGIHILDGDIVSPKSNVVIELTDENQFLLLDDTADYAVYITHPNGIEERIYFNAGTGQERMQFIPASLPRNNSKIIFEGNFPIDGGYKLRVQAADRTKNNSGSFDYIIGFEVINRSTITNIINYPNPFTTSTRFVFTLTGSEIPEVFKIQIMTITGKVVREIHKDELGLLHIGRNISDFAWNGTDTYGDRLANGLYLYRVITKINSNDIELRETSIDWYFKKGFGKMYLFR